MVSPNISNGARAPQVTLAAFKFLTEIDEAQAEKYLSLLEGSNPRLLSPFSGRLLESKYDPVKVLDAVDDIWPSRWEGRRGRGRKMTDPLPMVCFLLPLFDLQSGTFFNLSEAYRSFKEDNGYRRECGYVERLPSFSVFQKIAVTMAENRSRFEICVASPEVLQALVGRMGSGLFGSSSDSGSVGEIAPYAVALAKLGWHDGMPPLFLDDGKVTKALRTVGLARGRTYGARWDSVDEDAQVLLVDGGDAPQLSGRTCDRNWRAYNAAQNQEVTDVKALLGGFSDVLNLFEDRFRGPRGRGRPSFPLGHVVFAVVMKAYSGLSSRRLESPLGESVDFGYLRNVASGNGVDGGFVRIPQFNTVCNFLRSEWLTPLLLELVTATALPLKGVEHVFAVDGTGCSTRWYDRWLDHRLAKESDRQEWVKWHLVVGVKTNMIARAAISPGNHHDHPYFRPLVIETAKHFDVDTVVADLGYSSRSSHEVGPQLGVEVRIPFKSNTRPPSDNGSAWDADLRYFLENYDQFLVEYHLRSNVESANSTLKRIFLEKIRTESFVAQTNESLARFVGYNLRVLAREVRMRDLAVNLAEDALVLEDSVRQIVEMRSCQALAQAA